MGIFLYRMWDMTNIIFPKDSYKDTGLSGIPDGGVVDFYSALKAIFSGDY